MGQRFNSCCPGPSCYSLHRTAASPHGRQVRFLHEDRGIRPLAFQFYREPTAERG